MLKIMCFSNWHMQGILLDHSEIKVNVKVDNFCTGNNYILYHQVRKKF